MDESRISPEMIEGLTMKTGLGSETIVDLLSTGWRYVEKIGEISRWEHPMWQLEEQKVSIPKMYKILSKPVND